ncbi:hypothetical protein AVEN_51270-1, partial [Araneus ventricosus]
KALVKISWRHPPAYSWYRSEGPGAAIRFKGDRKDQTALARLSSGHLKSLRFSRGGKKFNIGTKCNMIEATPQHLLDCVALVMMTCLSDRISCWSNMALILILLRAGLEVDADVLKNNKSTCSKLIFLPFIAEFIAAGLSAHYLLNMPWIWSFLMA